MRIAIIGAGPAGLTCAKQAVIRGHDVTVFERCARLGGIWNPDSGGSYPSVRMQTSRSAFHYSDFAPAESGATMFLTRHEMYEYLTDYAKAFGVVDRIHFCAQVEQVNRSEGEWAIACTGPAGKSVQTFDRVIVAIGELWKPRMPANVGSSSACRIFSAKNYVSPAEFDGRKTLVVGGGVSGADIASEISQTGAPVHWSVRGNYFFLPRMWGEHANDGVFSYAGRAVVQQWTTAEFIDLLCRLLPEYMRKYRETGLLPRGTPNNAIHVNDTIIDSVWEGRVLVKPAYRGHGPDGSVHFRDGSSETYERIIFCMGYEAPEYRFIRNFEITDLYEHFFHRKDPSLAVVNTPPNVDGFGTACPFFEAIGRWVLSVFDGDTELPGVAEMDEWCAASRDLGVQRRFYDCWLETIRIALKSGQIPSPAAEFRKYWQVVSSVVTPLNLNAPTIRELPAPYDHLAGITAIKARVLASLGGRVRQSLVADAQITAEEARLADFVPAHEAIDPSLVMGARRREVGSHARTMLRARPTY